MSIQTSKTPGFRISLDSRARFAFGVFNLVVGVFFTTEAWKLALGDPGRPGPGLFPRVVAIALIVIAVLVILDSVTLHRRPPHAESPASPMPGVALPVSVTNAVSAHVEAEAVDESTAAFAAEEEAPLSKRDRTIKISMFAASLVIFVGLFDLLGFLVAGSLSLTVASKAFEEGQRPWWRAPVIGVATALGADLAFSSLRTQLPAGMFDITTAFLFQ